MESVIPISLSFAIINLSLLPDTLNYFSDGCKLACNAESDSRPKQRRHKAEAHNVTQQKHGCQHSYINNITCNHPDIYIRWCYFAVFGLLRRPVPENIIFNCSYKSAKGKPCQRSPYVFQNVSPKKYRYCTSSGEPQQYHLNSVCIQQAYACFVIMLFPQGAVFNYTILLRKSKVHQSFFSLQKSANVAK